MKTRIIICFFLLFSRLNAADIFNIGHLPREGLFSCFFGVLNALLESEKQNKIPVVYWHQNSLYYQEEGFNGSTNVWEYYFEPVSAYDYDPDSPIHRYVKSGCFYFTRFDQETRDKAHQVISTYIRIKPAVQKKIDDFYTENLIGKKIIGIHLRGTDRYQKKNPPKLEEIAETALQYAGKETQFFIASDEQILLDTMIQLLQPYPVYYYPCFRSLNGKGLHNGNHSDEEAPSKAQLGEDVIVEAMLLAKCDLLLHNPSSVSTAVLYFNPEMKNIIFNNSRK